MLLGASSASGQDGSPDRNVPRLFWLGQEFDGLSLTEEPLDHFFIYGDCEPPPGEGGCAPPLEVQNSTTCGRNPVGLDSLPSRLFKLRGGGLAADYGAWIDVGTGGRTVTVHSFDSKLAMSAVHEIRPRPEATPRELAPPVYPLPVLRELKRVTAAAQRIRGIKAIAATTDLSPGVVRTRLRTAKLLGPQALANIPVPTLSSDAVWELRQLAFEARELGFSGTAERHEISAATLRAKINQVRGLAGDC